MVTLNQFGAYTLSYDLKHLRSPEALLKIHLVDFKSSLKFVLIAMNFYEMNS